MTTCPQCGGRNFFNACNQCCQTVYAKIVHLESKLREKEGEVDRLIKFIGTTDPITVYEVELKETKELRSRILSQQAVIERIKSELEPEKLNEILKILAPTLTSFERNFCAYKLSARLTPSTNTKETK